MSLGSFLRTGLTNFFVLSALMVLVVFLCLDGGWGEALSFEDAVQVMKGRNEALLAAQDDIHQREAEQEAAKGLVFPKVDFDAKYTVLDRPVMIGMDPIPYRVQEVRRSMADTAVFQMEMQKQAFAKGEVKVSQPLYAGGRIRAARGAAGARKSDAVAQRAATENQLVTELAQRYYGLCLAHRNRDVLELKVAAMEQHAYRSRRLMEEGIIARVEFLNAEVARTNAKTELDAAERDIAIVMEGLANIIVSNEPVEPTSPLFVISDLAAREVFQDSVNDDHPIVKMLAAKLDLARQGVKAEQGLEKPLAYLFGMHELFLGDLSTQDPAWAVGVGVQCTLFDGFQGRHKVEAARAVEQKVGHLQQKACRDLKSLVLKRYEEMLKARDQFDSFDATLELTQENLRVRTRAFEEGMATSMEVVDAALSLARAQLGRFKAAYDFDFALFQLLEASGRTGEYREYLSRAMPVAERNDLQTAQPVH